MHRHLLSFLITLVISNTISLSCLVIAILSFTTKYVLGSHLTNMCNTTCLIFLTASIIRSRMPSPNPTTRVPDALQTLSPSPSARTPLPLSHSCLFHPDAQGGSLCGNGCRNRVQPRIPDPNSFLDLTSEESFQGTVPRRLRLAATTLLSYPDSGLGLSILSLEDASSEDEASEPINPPKVSDTDLDVGRPVVGGDVALPFRDQLSHSLSELSASRTSCRLS